MSEYQLFLHEREKIDLFLQKGYKIKTVTETLNGSLVEFEKYENHSEEKKNAILHIVTPNARKYFVAKLIQQQNVKV
jgi:hypothetical protein